MGGGDGWQTQGCYLLVLRVSGGVDPDNNPHINPCTDLYIHSS